MCTHNRGPRGMLTFRLAAQRVRNLESCGLEHERPITRKKKSGQRENERRDKTGTRNVSTESKVSRLNFNHAIISVI